MIGLLIDGILNGALDAARVLLMSREQERRWINADRGRHRPIYAPRIVRHYEPWPGQQQAGPPAGPRPYQRWPGDDR